MGKKKLNFKLIDIVLLALACAGAVIAVVGLFVPWFATTLKVLGESETAYANLFDELGDTDFPIVVVRIFGICAAVFAIIAAVVYLLRAFEVIKIGFFAKILLIAVVAVLGILTIVFAGSYAASLVPQVDGGDLAGLSSSIAYGVIFTGVGTLVPAAALLLN